MRHSPWSRVYARRAWLRTYGLLAGLLSADKRPYDTHKMTFHIDELLIYSEAFGPPYTFSLDGVPRLRQLRKESLKWRVYFFVFLESHRIGIEKVALTRCHLHILPRLDPAVLTLSSTIPKHTSAYKLVVYPTYLIEHRDETNAMHIP